MFKLISNPVQLVVILFFQVCSLFSTMQGVPHTGIIRNLKTTRTTKTASSNRTRKRSPLTSKKLTLLVDGSLYSHSFFKGDLMGMEYELLNLFAKENNLELEVKVVKHTAHLLDSLESGAGDIATGSLNVTPEHLQKVDFTHPVVESGHRLIQRAGAKQLVTHPSHLAGKKVLIRKNSSFRSTLQAYAEKNTISFTIQEASDTLTDENLIEMVAKGKIDYTVTNGTVAKTMGVFYNKIDYSFTLAEKQPVCWATCKHSEGLLETLNNWLTKRRRTLDYNLIVNKYTQLSETKKQTLRENFPLAKAGHISPYDELIKKNAKQLHWDWKLIAAVIFQESRFNPAAKSWVGATGLMQLMPATAKSLGVQPHQLTTPEKNIEAGIKYLKWLEKSWRPLISDENELIKFVLASYNVGMGHVMDARRLAQKNNLNAQKWEENVEKMLLDLSLPKYYKDGVVKYGYCRGKEPVSYVQHILEYYQSYKTFVN
jgi:membrane-bound lytic murein transglycosylase F